MIWFFMTVLAIVQGIGLLTFLHFNRKIKALKNGEEIKQETSKPKQPELHEQLGLTKEQYEKALSIVYGPNNDFTNFVNYPSATIIETEEESAPTVFPQMVEENNQINEISDEELSSVFEGVSEEELKTLIAQNQKKKRTNPSPVQPKEEGNSSLHGDTQSAPKMEMEMNDDPFGNESGWASFANDLDSLIGYEPLAEQPNIHIESEPIFEEMSTAVPDTKIPNNEPFGAEVNAAEQEFFTKPAISESLKKEETIHFQMGQGPNVSYENRKTSEVGESIDLYNEIMAVVSDEPTVPQVDTIAEQEVVFETEPIFQSNIEEIPLTDEDVPQFSEELSDIDIQMLNLLDMEAARLESETEGMIPLDDKERKKKMLTDRLTFLAEAGEGKKHMKEIVYTLHELYELEGKDDEMQKLREEYKEYFMEEDIELRIYEEDIIRVGKHKENPFQIPEKYLWLASNEIAEGKMGEQRWIGVVIGKNQNYIHFRDLSQRIWINVGKQVEQIEIGDLLAINVYRDSESVRAEEIFKLQKLQEVDYEPKEELAVM
jgi:hypothetical protein